MNTIIEQVKWNKIWGNNIKPYFVRFGTLENVLDNEIVYIPSDNLERLTEKNIAELAYTKKEIIEHIKEETSFTSADIKKHNMVAKLLFSAEGNFINDYNVELTEQKYLDENTPIFRQLTDLTNDELWELRQQICLNSIYFSDYYNKFKICSHECCNFFEMYVEFLSNKENWDILKTNNNEYPKDITDIIEIINCLDNKENLADFRINEY